MTRAAILRDRIATGETTLASAAGAVPDLTTAMLRALLTEHHCNRTAAAAALNLTYSTLARVIREHLPTLREELDGDPARAGGGWRPGHDARRLRVRAL